mmetsp:Transcript_11805/g.35543  ORF Transcript_11805/g.35543 Transcript_11805/m.35543 type:complete len:358 (-) Transcript_11805:1437-2510(-)
MLGKIGAAIKGSPRAIRKAFSSRRELRAGKSKEHSHLKGCLPNGWLYRDDDVRTGINYKVKYLGSVEVDFNPEDQEANQVSAETAMRALKDHNKEQKLKLPLMGLQVSMRHLILRSGDGGRVVMRHSTTRVAYSTVDAACPKTFCYVAVVKGTELALCHVFNCKSSKQGFEMTFVCAQAFDLNLRYWTAHREKAYAEAEASEKKDIQPENAWQKKQSDDEGHPPNPPSATELVKTVGQTPAAAASPPAAAAAGAGISPVSPRTEKIFFGARGGEDPAVLAGEYFASLGVNLVEPVEDEEDCEPRKLRRRDSLSVGIDAEVWEGDDAGADGGGVGYMTVGPVFDFSGGDDDDGFDDDL